MVIHLGLLLLTFLRPSNSYIQHSAFSFDFMTYAKLLRLSKRSSKDIIGIIYAIGNIDDVPSYSSISPQKIRKAFESARQAGVKAIVLRINSGGGDAEASDSLWEEVRKMRDNGIPVIASVSSVAASGAYLMIAPCNEIYATPGCITGSIGVVGGKFVYVAFVCY